MDGSHGWRLDRTLFVVAAEATCIPFIAIHADQFQQGDCPERFRP
jgi:hypothetical protein